MFCISCGFSVICCIKDCIPGEVNNELPVKGSPDGSLPVPATEMQLKGKKVCKQILS